jgi:hypothetical protein
MARTDAEYILMGKIMEKHQDILFLSQELKNLENWRKTSPVAPPVPQAEPQEETHQPLYEQETEEEEAPLESQEAAHDDEALETVAEEENQQPPSSPPLTAISLNVENMPDMEQSTSAVVPFPRKFNFNRKNIPCEKKLKLVENDNILAISISSGNNINVRWGKKSCVPSWSNGRKYDPTIGKIFRIRTELRKGDLSMRELSGYTDYALDTIKDLVREMDKQGFFTNT